MGLVLTATTSRPVSKISDQSPASQPLVSDRIPNELPTPRAEPPAKRRRVKDGRPVTARSRRTIQDFLRAQVFPHVERVVHDLPESHYNVSEIAVEVAKQFLTPKFRARFDDAGGWLSAQEEADIAKKARSEVYRLISLKQYQLKRTLSPTLIPDESKNNAPPIPITKSPQSNDSEPVSDETQTPEDDGCSEDELQSDISASPEAAPAISLPALRVPLRQRLMKRAPPLDRQSPINKWFTTSERPYCTSTDRDAIVKGTKHNIRVARGDLQQPVVYHVDFTSDEVAEIIHLLSPYTTGQVPATLEGSTRLCQTYNVPSLVGTRLKGRSIEDIRNFCSDVLAGKVVSLHNANLLSLNRDTSQQRQRSMHSSRTSSLLLAREIEGNAGFGRMRRFENFQNEFKKALEDDLQLVAEYTNCAGDITTGSWISNEDFICGTTAHSDSHNQQYNKPGNLLLCSTAKGTLRAFPDHRIPRPLVEKGENSTAAMRQSQDPWLYSSVVSSDFDPIHDLAFTSSFDKTVKVWKVDRSTGSMHAIATWHHGGNVNFVSVAKDGSGRVATAADVPSDAVRVYTINRDDIAGSPYQTFSCSRTDADGTSEKWAYFPATLQWGRAPYTQHLLLVGYSPRSTSHDDADIAEDKRKSGEITLWDAVQSRRLPVMTASTANVFEVAWHPTLPRFLAATTPCGPNVDHSVHTQIHVFQRDRERQDGAYGEFQTLDCPAYDINELTFMPNSVRHAYVTAACTDGNVYVWDTAEGDNPIHVLKHGHPLEEFYEDREREDTGVKFTAWGSSPDRLYTGSSDGVVKIWNIRNRRKTLVRTLLEAPGPISFGFFSPDHSKLAVGDATGRVFVLSVDERDEHESHMMTLPGTTRRVRRPRPFLPHPEPPAPETNEDEQDVDTGIASYARKTYLDTHQLVLTSNPTIGAVKGPLYSATNLFRREAHLDQDPSLPLLARFERFQKDNEALSLGSRRRSVRRTGDPGNPSQRLLEMHQQNCTKDLSVEMVQDKQLQALVRLGIDAEEDWGFHYEELPSDEED